MRWLLALIAGFLLVSAAHADMYPDASNAKLPEAQQNLGILAIDASKHVRVSGAAPICVVTWRAAPLASQSYTTDLSALTLTQTATSGNLVDYVCYGRAGG